MTELISGMSVGEAGNLATRLALFLKDSPESVQRRFDELLADIDAGSVRHSFVADVLSSLIRDSLSHTCTQLPTRGDQRRFLHDVVKSLDRIFGDLLRVSRTTQIYASDLSQVWVACEPMLDLLPEPEGFLDTVASVLTRKHVRYYYFLSETSCYNDLVELMRKRKVSADAIGRLHLVRIPEPYTPPVAMYIHGERVVGLRGRGRPPLTRADNGSWQIKKPLDPGWASLLDPNASHRHYNDLGAYLKTEETV